MKVPDTTTVLQHGEFLGEVRNRICTPDFVISEIEDRATDEVPRHTHANTHFLLVLRGRCRTSARNGGGICPPATLIFNPAGTTHQDRFEIRGGAFLAVSVEPERLGTFEGGAVAYRDCVEAWLATRLYRETQDPDDVVLEALGMELLAVATGTPAPSASRAPDWLVEAREMLEELFPEPVRVAEVAAAVGVHPFHLARTFRRFLRCTPGDYLRRCRIRRAACMLQTSRTPLATVAAETGFNDQSQFTKTFRRLTGFTPAAYRRAFDDVGFAQDRESGQT